MSDIVCYESDGSILQYYTQWDINQKLVVRGADISSAPNFHFSNALIDDAYVIKSVISNGELVASVPDEILQYSASIIVHIQYRTGETEYEIRIPVMPRKKPDNYIYTDTESDGTSSGQVIIANNLTTNDPSGALSAAQGVVIKSRLDNIDESILDIEKSIDELEKNGGNNGTSGGGVAGGGCFVVQNEAPNDTSVLWVDPDDNSDNGFQEAVDTALARAKESGEFDGDDYILTYADKTEIAGIVAELVDVPGSGVENGFSPIISITDIDRGHIITITDVNGTQSFTVLDGEDGHTPGFTIGQVTTLSAGSMATATITGTKENPVLNLGIPKGYDGSNGDGGDSGVVAEEGATFTPYVDSNGNISWTNNKELPNPQEVNIKGPAGDNGATFIPNVNSIGVISWTNDKNLQNPKAVNIKGPAGDDGVGITRIEQTTTSAADNGTNVITATLSNGQKSSFNIKNGSKGSNATINGVNTLTLDTGAGIDKVQNGSTLTISGNLTNMLASGPMILREGLDFHYGDTLPPPGNKGRIFYKRKVSE